MNALGCESVTGEGTCKKQSFCHLLNPNKIWFAGLVSLLHTQYASQAWKLMDFFLFSLSLTYSSVSFIHLTTSHSLLTPHKSVSYQLESNDWVILAIQYSSSIIIRGLFFWMRVLLSCLLPIWDVCSSRGNPRAIGSCAYLVWG